MSSHPNLRINRIERAALLQALERERDYSRTLEQDIIHDHNGNGRAMAVLLFVMLVVVALGWLKFQIEPDWLPAVLS